MSYKDLGGVGMEKLVQKYSGYVYIVCICAVVVQLINTIVGTLDWGYNAGPFILILLSIVNIMLLISTLLHNARQRFTECKTNAKILRITLAILVICRMICLGGHLTPIVLLYYIVNIVMIELFLCFRIKCIEYLEKLANQFMNNKEGEK